MNPATQPTSPAPRASRLTLRGMCLQTLAMAVDAYRELNSKKLFWITLSLSGVVVAAFAGIGFDDYGFSTFGKHWDSPFFNTRIMAIEQLYKNLFIVLGVQWWLGFFAIILALVSTASIFPDFLSGGAVDLYLARPLGRVRLFLTKYLMGLLFVALQVTVFCFACFLVVGFRTGAWIPGLFLGVPVVVLLFSYLWCICAFLGLVTRSTIASLMLTMMAWAGIFGLHFIETLLLAASVGSQIEARELERDINRYQAEIQQLGAKVATTQPTNWDQSRLFQATRALEKAKSDREGIHDSFAPWHDLFYAAKWPLPKTTETTALMARWLDQQFRPHMGRGPRDDDDEERHEQEPQGFFQNRRIQMLAAVEVDKILRDRPIGWVIGTSLGFEACVLALSALIFARRDY